MSILTFLPLDLSAGVTGNRILGEEHTLIQVNQKTERLLLPIHGGFYTKDFKLYDAQGVLLTLGVDYKPTYLYRELSELTGREVYGMVVVINPSVSAQVSLDYRAVGGFFNVSVEELKTLLASLDDSLQPVEWEAIIAKPAQYNPDEHPHKLWQIYGFSNTNKQVERIGHAYSKGMGAVLDYEEQYGNNVLDECEALITNLHNQVEAHVSNFNNPHQVTKDQVGLSQINNWGLGTYEQAVGWASNVYASPANVYQGLSVTAYPSYQAHINNTNNPHQVTLAQIDAYSTAELNTLAATRLGRNERSVDSAALQGRDYTTTFWAIRNGLDTSNVTTGVFSTTRLGSGDQNQYTALLGDKTFHPLQDIFNIYSRPVRKTAYIGYYGSDALAVEWLNTSLGDTTQWPVGSIAFVRVYMQWTGGDSSLEFDEVHMAERTASGWVMY